MQKYSRARQATGDSVIQHMRFACWISEATDVQTEYVLLLFHGDIGCQNVSHWHITRILPVLFFLLQTLISIGFT